MILEGQPDSWQRFETKLSLSREFWLLFCVGLGTATVLALLLLVSATGLGRGPIWRPVFTSWLRTVVGLAIAVSLGLLAARRIGLGAPVVEAFIGKQPIIPILRSMFWPVVIAAATIAVFSATPNFHVFHPNRAEELRFADQVYRSDAAAKVIQKIDSVLSTSRALVPISYLNSAIVGELISRLFFVSAVAWILGRIISRKTEIPDAWIMYAAIALVAISNTSFIVFQRWRSEQLGLLAWRLEGLNPPRDPIWLLSTRIFIGTLPAELLLGWLYVRRGLESAIFASFLGRLMQHALTTLVFVRLL